MKPLTFSIVWLVLITNNILFTGSNVLNNRANWETLRVYAAPKGAPVSDKRFSVQVRQGKQPWQSISVYAFLKQTTYNRALTGEPQFVIFESHGDVSVEIEVKAPLKSFLVRPGSLNVKAVQNGQKILLTMNDKVRQLAVEINGEMKMPLLLFSNPIDLNQPDPKAIPSTMTYFGPGYHRINGDGAIQGKSVYLAGGAVVEGHFDIKDESNIEIKGSGILYNPKIEGKDNLPVIRFTGCSNVSIEGIVCVQRPDNWGVKAIASHDIRYNNFKVITEIRDGISVLNSQRFTAQNCFIMAHDDVVCMKGVKEGRNQPVEDVLIEHCILSNMGGGSNMEIGYESVNPVYQRITFQDIDVIHSLPEDSASPVWPTAVISIHPTQMTEYSDPAYMGVMPPIHNVTYRNIRIESAFDRFYFDIFPNRNSPGKGIENILFENITITDSPDRPSRILGRMDHPIRNITFRNLKINGRQILKASDGDYSIDNAMTVVFEK
jgi:hypothetical protein